MKSKLPFFISLAIVTLFWMFIYYLIGSKIFVIAFSIIGVITVITIMATIVHGVYIAIIKENPFTK